ncbi:MAG: hypothetical protein IT348_19410 [Candidatus Eisenbacteria bacterium]|nr:hypothetical protein [Candidatus Eisenbacteria bacterium]
MNKLTEAAKACTSAIHEYFHAANPQHTADPPVEPIALKRAVEAFKAADSVELRQQLAAMQHRELPSIFGRPCWSHHHVACLAASWLAAVGRDERWWARNAHEYADLLDRLIPEVDREAGLLSVARDPTDSPSDDPCFPASYFKNITTVGADLLRQAARDGRIHVEPRKNGNRNHYSLKDVLRVWPHRVLNKEP